MQISVKVDKKLFDREMKKYKNQIPFAVSKALNATITQAQTDIRGHMKEAFTIRREAFARNSIKVTEWAKKQSLKAVVAIAPPGQVDPFSMHVVGGTKRPVSGKSVAIPLRAIQPDKKKVISKAKRPRQLANSFVTKQSDGQKFIMIRRGKGKKATVRPAYLLVPSVRIKPSFQFYQVGQTSVSRNWSRNFDIAWKNAVRTAK